jgi:hypothetical protein
VTLVVGSPTSREEPPGLDKLELRLLEHIGDQRLRAHARPSTPSEEGAPVDVITSYAERVPPPARVAGPDSRVLARRGFCGAADSWVCWRACHLPSSLKSMTDA